MDAVLNATAPSTASTATPSAPTMPPTMSTITSSAASGSGTDRTTMIVVVACVVAVFAVVVIIAIVRTARKHKNHAPHRQGGDPPTTPMDDSNSHAYSAPSTTLKVRARPTHVTPFKPSDAHQRPSQAHTERTTIASMPRASESVLLVNGKLDSMNSEDDMAMLQSYAQSRRAFQDESFISAINFDDDSSRSLDVGDSLRSLDIDAFRHSAGEGDTSLSTASSSTAYWRCPEDTLCFADEDDGSPRSFTDAQEPHPRRQTSVDF